MGSTKKILVAPLDWGLGHATRSMPIINYLSGRGHIVHLAGDGRSGKLLRKEYPHLPFHPLPAYDVNYPLHGNFLFKTLLQAPKIRKAIRLEHRELGQLMKNHSFDLVISDNRYGMYTEKSHSVILTHQIHLQLPKPFKGLEKLVSKILGRYLGNFDQVWVPDHAGLPNFSGGLSHGPALPGNIQYIGPLSRFHQKEHAASPDEYDFAVILSGPEPQRTLLEQIIIPVLNEMNTKSIVVQGKTEAANEYGEGSVKVISSCTSSQLLNIIQSAKMIISRCGYSSVMDYVCLGKPAILIPTPGQTEQEYLAQHLFNAGLFYHIPQAALSSEKIKAAVGPLHLQFPTKSFNRFEHVVESTLTQYSAL